MEVEGRMDYKDQKVMEMFIILIIVMASQTYTYVKTHQIGHFQYGQLILC